MRFLKRWRVAVYAILPGPWQVSALFFLICGLQSRALWTECFALTFTHPRFLRGAHVTGDVPGLTPSYAANQSVDLIEIDRNTRPKDAG
ncbi:hypothetical protein PGT21_033570 [Puccinia graminis f. sp. tritici]|uniref:Uncharacterized protein n=1 Tax=Puccinia graminis f. sp. tritici TaxID=56615 RepID=A0A5B0LQ13_PUCGR|nr:hypothetical protein PGT21_033570 [Puccinia graminis f. sp. tritici]